MFSGPPNAGCFSTPRISFCVCVWWGKRDEAKPLSLSVAFSHPLTTFPVPGSAFRHILVLSVALSLEQPAAHSRDLELATEASDQQGAAEPKAWVQVGPLVQGICRAEAEAKVGHGDPVFATLRILPVIHPELDAAHHYYGVSLRVGQETLGPVLPLCPTLGRLPPLPQQPAEGIPFFSPFTDGELRPRELGKLLRVTFLVGGRRRV